MTSTPNPKRNAVRMLPHILAAHAIHIGHPLNVTEKLEKMNDLGLTYSEMSVALGWTKRAVEDYHRNYDIPYNRSAKK